MSYNPKSLILLLLLLAIALFLGGFRLGKHVEQLDKSYVPPTPFPSPTQLIEPTITAKPLAFSVYKNGFCGVSFLYPYYLKEKSSSDEAKLEKGDEFILVSCNKNRLKETQEAIKNLEEPTTQTVRSRSVSLYKKSKGKTVWITTSVDSGKKIVLEASDELVDLILKTLDRN